ncbi:MAG: protein-L-isoaspartate(D-aspartate) O-methyltransferase [Nitrospinota bacterium]|nr:MAG: protein-L-isoaspartate(D-aspartate) O-methyltransferase [Nitrospinota bacterium]
MPPYSEEEFTRARKEMIREQLIARGIEDPQVLLAISKVPRHRFVPLRYRAKAYQDRALPIEKGQTISQPYIVAFMTQALGLRGGETVLEVGTGSGYQAAVLAQIAGQVYSIERYPELAEQARTLLQELGYTNIEIRVGDGSQGWPEQAPYDGIIVTAAAPEVPAPLVEQLKVGGRLVIPVGSRQEQVLYRLRKTEDGVQTERMIGCVFVPLIGTCGWQEEGDPE